MGDAVILILFAKRDRKKLAGWSMNHRTTAYLLTQCAVSKPVRNSANLPGNLIPKKKKLLFTSNSGIILGFQGTPISYSQKDAITIYLSLPDCLNSTQHLLLHIKGCIQFTIRPFSAVYMYNCKWLDQSAIPLHACRIILCWYMVR